MLRGARLSLSGPAHTKPHMCGMERGDLFHQSLSTPTGLRLRHCAAQIAEQRAEQSGAGRRATKADGTRPAPRSRRPGAPSRPAYELTQWGTRLPVSRSRPLPPYRARRCSAFPIPSVPSVPAPVVPAVPSVLAALVGPAVLADPASSARASRARRACARESRPSRGAGARARRRPAARRTCSACSGGRAAGAGRGSSCRRRGAGATRAGSCSPSLPVVVRRTGRGVMT